MKNDITIFKKNNFFCVYSIINSFNIICLIIKSNIIPQSQTHSISLSTDCIKKIIWYLQLLKLNIFHKAYWDRHLFVIFNQIRSDNRPFKHAIDETHTRRPTRTPHILSRACFFRIILLISCVCSGLRRVGDPLVCLLRRRPI